MSSNSNTSSTQRSAQAQTLLLTLSPTATAVDLRPLGIASVGAVTDTTPTDAARPDPTMLIPWGPVNLGQRWLAEDDPPRPEALTNALGAIDDYLADVDREIGPDVRAIAMIGEGIGAVARLEAGVSNPTPELVVDRRDLEEVFRIAATEGATRRAENPGLLAGDAETVIPTLCIALAAARRYRVPSVHLHHNV